MKLRCLGRASAAVLVLLGFGALFACNTASARPNTTPDPAVDESVGAKSGQQTLVLSGGCFWGQQLVFEHVKGVVNVTAGYSGGSVKNPSYEMVSSGTTGHAESVKITYDPSQITYGRLLKVFFFRSARSDRTEPPGAGRGNSISLRHFSLKIRTNSALRRGT